MAGDKRLGPTEGGWLSRVLTLRGMPHPWQFHGGPLRTFPGSSRSFRHYSPGESGQVQVDDTGNNLNLASVESRMAESYFFVALPSMTVAHLAPSCDISKVKL